MYVISRRKMLRIAYGIASGLVVAGCGSGPDAGRPTARHTQAARAPQVGGRAGPVRLIGDGSTADTGVQPNQPTPPVPLEPGEPPPQFVVFSWDGAGELDNGLFERFRGVAREHDAAMTFFLSGLYLLPEGLKHLYRPPNNPVGASDIGYLTDAHIRGTLRQLRLAWLEGHEIGTHFNGHFCAGSGSVANWSPSDWDSEIRQAVSFVEGWRTNTGFTDLEPLPFDYRAELVGARTPCLLGRDNLLPVAARLGWRYDASSPGGLQQWPEKKYGLWDLPLQSVPFPGHSFEVLSMDYNMLANQSRGRTRGTDPRDHPGWQEQARTAYILGFQRAYHTNRAPFFIGNHFEEWNGGIYMNAVEDALRYMAGRKEVRMVSFRQLVDWLDVQNPQVLARLRTLGVGQAPEGGWRRFLASNALSAPTAPSATTAPTAPSAPSGKASVPEFDAVAEGPISSHQRSS